MKLKLLTEDDMSMLVENINRDTEGTKYMQSGIRGLTVAESIQHHAENRAVGGLSCAVSEGGNICGVIDLHHVDRINSKAEISIYIWRRDRGYGLAAIKELTQYCFDKLNLNKLIVKTNALNGPCIKVFEKAGYRVEATIPNELFYNGYYVGMTCLGITNYEWREIK